VPVKLLSKTNGLINLLSSKPYYTFTKNILWKLGTRLMWISMGPYVQIL